MYQPGDIVTTKLHGDCVVGLGRVTKHTLHVKVIDTGRRAIILKEKVIAHRPGAGVEILFGRPTM